MKLTTNLNLKKPDYIDLVDIQDINSNMDTIDSAIQSKADKTYVDNKVNTDTEFMVGRANDTTEGIIPGNY